MRISVVQFTFIGVVLTVTAGSAHWAQSPAFEVATVKIDRTGDNGLSRPELRNGTLTARNVSMRMLLRAAYDLSEPQTTGPDWLDSDRYDLAAKSPQGVPDSELMPMLQALLKERFHLAFHREVKEMPVFDMVVAKGGLKIWLFDPARPVPKPPLPAHVTSAMVASNGVVTMPQLAIQLTYSAGRPVLDKTGLEGRYGYFLFYTTLSAQSDDATAGSGPPDFFAAVEQQLGLRLEPKKESIEILVVDHAERVPTQTDIGNLCLAYAAELK
jgi:uncharacterized protein (TIGR03435 family)